MKDFKVSSGFSMLFFIELKDLNLLDWKGIFSSGQLSAGQDGRTY